MSTEVVLLLPVEDGIFDDIHGIPRNFAEFHGIFTLKFRGIPRDFAEFFAFSYTEFRMYFIQV